MLIVSFKSMKQVLTMVMETQSSEQAERPKLTEY